MRDHDISIISWNGHILCDCHKEGVITSTAAAVQFLYLLWVSIRIIFVVLAWRTFIKVDGTTLSQPIVLGQ